jgi:DNA-directed RNA polymerase subunit RPC12/RpoP
MSGPQFFQTAMGRTFYEGTMPELVKQLKRLNANLEPHPDSLIPYVLTPQGRQQDTTVPISDGDGNDLHIPEATCKEGFWLTVGKASIHIKDGDDGVSVAVYAKGAEMESAIGETWVTHGELEGEDTDKKVPKCPTCGSTRLHVTIHTMYEMVEGKLGKITTDGPEENLSPEDYTVCPNCDHEGDFSEFDKEE